MGKTESKRGNGTAPTRLVVQRTMDTACTRKLQAYKVFAPVNTPPVFGPVVLSLESSARRCPPRQGHGGVVFLDILFNDECFCIVFCLSIKVLYGHHWGWAQVQAQLGIQTEPAGFERFQVQKNLEPVITSRIFGFLGWIGPSQRDHVLCSKYCFVSFCRASYVGCGLLVKLLLAR